MAVGREVSEVEVGGARPAGVGPLVSGAGGGGRRGGVGGGQDGTVGVLAGAMPADRVRWWREIASGAGLNLRRIGLRCAGGAALLAELSQRRAGPIMGVSVGAGSTEFVIVEDGQM